MRFLLLLLVFLTIVPAANAQRLKATVSQNRYLSGSPPYSQGSAGNPYADLASTYKNEYERIKKLHDKYFKRRSYRTYPQSSAADIDALTMLKNMEMERLRALSERTMPQSDYGRNKHYSRIQETASWNSISLPAPPEWIQEKVYTKETLIGTYRAFEGNPDLGPDYAIHNYKMMKIPQTGTANLRLDISVVESWKGYTPYPCYVTCIPYGPEGNYKFFHDDPYAPRGYLQFEGFNDEGYANYRYWFEDILSPQD